MVIKLIENTNIRIGNEAYKKLYGTFGLTTLRDKHVKFQGNEVTFTFSMFDDLNLSVTSALISAFNVSTPAPPSKVSPSFTVNNEALNKSFLSVPVKVSTPVVNVPVPLI